MGAHFHLCPYCCADEICRDARCSLHEDDDLVQRGAPTICSDPICAEEARRQEAMELLGWSPLQVPDDDLYGPF